MTSHYHTWQRLDDQTERCDCGLVCHKRTNEQWHAMTDTERADARIKGAFVLSMDCIVWFDGGDGKAVRG